MKISRVQFNNFRIYRGSNEISFSSTDSKNISLIAGKNGFGKTTFLTSLIWAFYGKLMGQVEEKYKKDIKTAGGYDNYVTSLLNNNVKWEFENGKKATPLVSVEIELKDLLIPTIPCRTVTVKRSFDLRTNEEKLSILIDGLENELTKEVGYEVFINDFILPREIAKFFFFDAEKIVSLAEAKSKSELRSLSKAYSEVLGIKKYEELKSNLEGLLIKLRRRGVKEVEKSKLDELIEQVNNDQKQIENNRENQESLDLQIALLKTKSDNLQEKLIREGNSITLEELKDLKNSRETLKSESKIIKNKLKKLLDIMPFVIAGKKLTELYNQMALESSSTSGKSDSELIQNEINEFSNRVLKDAKKLFEDQKTIVSIEKLLNKSKSSIHVEKNKTKVSKTKVLLDFNEEQVREFQAIVANIKTSYLSQFNAIVQEEKNNRVLLSRTINKIKQAEARKGNQIAKEYREEKDRTDSEIFNLTGLKNNLIEKLGGLLVKAATNKKVLSEYEKNFNLVETDKKKYEVTEKLLKKINELIQKIKQEKKYALQKSISLGLRNLMHKENFVSNVRVNIQEDIMDIDLLDERGNIIDKDSLSKGEQQLYATALLKALVDESGISFPVFIDSPLQKFDKHHSKNILKEFYPSISEQVVLFPLLEKELSEDEYELLKKNLNTSYLIINNAQGSTFKKVADNKLFQEFKKTSDVYAY
ncbi:MAG: AAA family ATPase [Flavobacteriaceae bacterium]